MHESEAYNDHGLFYWTLDGVLSSSGGTLIMSLIFKNLLSKELHDEMLGITENSI
jgi:hypothetical protein